MFTCACDVDDIDDIDDDVRVGCQSLCDHQPHPSTHPPSWTRKVRISMLCWSRWWARRCGPDERVGRAAEEIATASSVVRSSSFLSPAALGSGVSRISQSWDSRPPPLCSLVFLTYDSHFRIIITVIGPSGGASYRRFAHLCVSFPLGSTHFSHDHIAAPSVHKQPTEAVREGTAAFSLSCRPRGLRRRCHEQCRCEIAQLAPLIECRESQSA